MGRQTSTNTMVNTSHNLKEMSDKLKNKENELKEMNDKIMKICQNLKTVEEETKMYTNLIDKEEAEGERLRHFLNYLMSKS